MGRAPEAVLWAQPGFVNPSAGPAAGRVEVFRFFDSDGDIDGEDAVDAGESPGFARIADRCDRNGTGRSIGGIGRELMCELVALRAGRDRQVVNKCASLKRLGDGYASVECSRCRLEKTSMQSKTLARASACVA